MARSHSFWKGPSRHCKKLCLRAWPKDTSTHQSVKQHLLSKDAAACIAATSRHINRHERHERHERQERHGNCSSFPGSRSSRLSFEFVNHLYPKSKAPHSANQEIAKMKGSGRVFFVLSRRAPTTLTNLVLQANMVARFCTVAADVVCKALWNLRIEVPQPKETRKLDTAHCKTIDRIDASQKNIEEYDTSSEFDGLSKGAQNQRTLKINGWLSEQFIIIKFAQLQDLWSFSTWSGHFADDIPILAANPFKVWAPVWESPSFKHKPNRLK